LLENGSPGGVGAWLKNGPETAPYVLVSEGFEGLVNRGGVVSEIVNHRDATDFASDFLSAFYPAKPRQRITNDGNWDTEMSGGSGCHGGVSHIELAGERNFEGFTIQKERRTRSVFWLGDAV
jgi:hypothetical protein